MRFFNFLIIIFSFQISVAQSLLTDSLKLLLSRESRPLQRAELLNQLAYTSYRENVSLGKSYAYKALQLSEQYNLDKPLVNSYINLGRCYRLENNWDSAEWVLKTALKTSQNVHYDEGGMNAANNLGATYLMQGKTDQAKPLFESALTTATRINDAKGQANAYNNLAIIAKSEMDYLLALHYLDSARVVYTLISDSSGISTTYTNQALVYDLLEENDSAIVYFFLALRIQEGLGLEYQKGITLNQIGDLYFEKGLHKEALQQYQASLQIMETIGDAIGVVDACQNIGATMSILGNPVSAFPFLSKGLEYARISEDPEKTGISLINLGKWYSQSGNEKKAWDHFREAETLLKPIRAISLSQLYGAMGNLAGKQGNLMLAHDLFQQQLQLAREFEDLYEQQFALQYISELYRKQGNINLALAYTDQYHLIKDSLLNLKALETVNRLNIAYESEKKEKANLSLKTEVARQNARRIQMLSLAILIFLIGLSVFLWFLFRQRLRNRAHEMELQQERQRQQQLAELDATKSRFFANISHEFRTPLTLILGQNQHLQATVDDPALDSKFDMVDRNGRRLLELINQVLDLAKLESGKREWKPQTLDIIPFLKNQLFSFESLAEQKKQTLTYNGPADSLLIVADPEKLERIFYNLLSNAIKFTPEKGEITLLVDKTGGNVQISLKDTGIGIATSQLPYIFDRFYQADAGANHPSPGTGIGLALAKELAELHNGTLTVSSQPGEGSIFTVKLPLNTAIPQAVVTEYLPQLHPFEQIPILQETKPSVLADSDKEKILIVEDNPDVRSYLFDQLKRNGYEVIQTINGQEGLSMAKTHLPDLILSDVMMPRMDGFQFAKAIRKDQSTSHIPLVLLTAKASEESRITGLETGVDDYLTKPFNEKELKIRIANLISQRKLLRQRFSEALIIKAEDVTAVPMDQQFLQKVTETIEANLTNEQFGVETLSEAVNMSVTHLNRKLNALIGQSAGKLIRSMRMQRAADLLKQQAGTVSEIAFELCFSDPTNFARSFRQQFGVNPSEWRGE
ncbi:MAG: tetratricopeptide repeat protein [Bacteroidia bacterium]